MWREKVNPISPDPVTCRREFELLSPFLPGTPFVWWQLLRRTRTVIYFLNTLQSPVHDCPRRLFWKILWILSCQNHCWCNQTQLRWSNQSMWTILTCPQGTKPKMWRWLFCKCVFYSVLGTFWCFFMLWCMRGGYIKKSLTRRKSWLRLLLIVCWSIVYI